MGVFSNKASLRQKEALFAFQRSLVSDAKKACFQSGGIAYRFQCFCRAGKYPSSYASCHVFSPFPPTPVGLKCGVSHALYTRKSFVKYYNLLNFTNINIRAMRPHFILNKKTVILQSDYWGYT